MQKNAFGLGQTAWQVIVSIWLQLYEEAEQEEPPPRPASVKELIKDDERP